MFVVIIRLRYPEQCICGAPADVCVSAEGYSAFMCDYHAKVAVTYAQMGEGLN